MIVLEFIGYKNTGANGIMELNKHGSECHDKQFNLIWIYFIFEWNHFIMF